MKSDRSFAAPTKAKFFYEYLETQLEDHDIDTPVLDEAFLATSSNLTPEDWKMHWMWPHYLPFFNEDETLKATIAQLHVKPNVNGEDPCVAGVGFGDYCGRRHKRRRH